MPLRVTLKVSARTTRPFDLPYTEDQFAEMRQVYWAGRDKDSKPDDAHALHLAKAPFFQGLIKLSDQGETVVTRCITSLTIWVEGTYWYKHRTPPVSKHTRVRTFVDEDGTVNCPKCDCLLIDEGELLEEPVGFTKTLNNPRFICPHCNSMVQVSSRSEEYRDKSKLSKSQ